MKTQQAKVVDLCEFTFKNQQKNTTWFSKIALSYERDGHVFRF